MNSILEKQGTKRHQETSLIHVTSKGGKGTEVCGLRFEPRQSNLLSSFLGDFTRLGGNKHHAGFSLDL